MSFGSNLKEMREKLNMSQTDLANKVFVSRQAVSRWERDETQPDIETIKKIAQALNTTQAELLGEEAKVIESTVVVEKKSKPIKLIAIIGSIITVCIIIITVIAVNSKKETVEVEYLGYVITKDFYYENVDDFLNDNVNKSIHNVFYINKNKPENNIKYTRQVYLEYGDIYLSYLYQNKNTKKAYFKTKKFNTSYSLDAKLVTKTKDDVYYRSCEIYSIAPVKNASIEYYDENDMLVDVQDIKWSFNTDIAEDNSKVVVNLVYCDNTVKRTTIYDDTKLHFCKALYNIGMGYDVPPYVLEYYEIIIGRKE